MIPVSLAKLCSFQGPLKRAPAGFAVGLSKLNSMRDARSRERAPSVRGPVDIARTCRLELAPRSCEATAGQVLLSWSFPRKEVIQPHLPVRLPCYDFTPVTSPTFDGSLPKG